MLLTEFGLGLLIAVLVFSFYIGLNVLPFLAVGTVLVLIYFALNNKQLLTIMNKGTSIKSNIQFDDIGGQNIPKQELKEALDFMIHSEKASKLGIRPLKGIMLSGPPGTGKTLLAKAAATYTDSVFLAASGSEFVEMYAGVGAQRVRALFKKARSKAKKENKNRAIIFIDEIEVLGRKRGTESNHMEYDQTLNQLLIEMDGIRTEETIKVLIIAATNRLDMLDEALLRPGRFDRNVKVDLPEKDARLEILKIHVKNKPLSDDVILDSIAKETFSFSGAHLESVVNEAAIYALRDNVNAIYQKHFKEAIDKVMLGEKLDKKPSTNEIRRISLHEIAHATIAEIFKPNSVACITITPRGKAMGYMRQEQTEEKYVYTKEEFIAQINISLAGACAEKIILGNMSTGSTNDFQEAIKLATQIITSGLSALGIVNEKIDKDLINAESKKIINEQLQILEKIIEEKTTIIEKITEILIAEEKITGDEFRTLLKIKNNECA